MPSIKNRKTHNFLPEKDDGVITKGMSITPTPKLNMQKVEVYDNTESKVAVVQKSILRAAFQRQHRRGLGLLSTAGTVLLTTFPLLTAVTSYQDFLGVPAASWPAIYFMLWLISLIAFIFLLFLNFRDSRRDGDPVEEFFGDDKKLN